MGHSPGTFSDFLRRRGSCSLMQDGRAAPGGQTREGAQAQGAPIPAPVAAGDQNPSWGLRRGQCSHPPEERRRVTLRRLAGVALGETLLWPGKSLGLGWGALATIHSSVTLPPASCSGRAAR